MKKLYCLLLSVLLVICICACATGTTAEDSGAMDLSEYTIVVPRMVGEYLRDARFLQNLVGNKDMPIEKEEAEGKCIVLLSNDKLASCTIGAEGENLVIEGPLYMLMSAIRSFFSEGPYYLPESPYEYVGPYENGLLAVESEVQTVREGITYTRTSYEDPNTLPVVAYLLKIEKGAATLINGTGNNSYEMIDNRATTTEAAKSAMDAGYNVIAAVNADFFDINGTGAPRGTCIKDSVVMQVSDDPARSFFAVMDDGSYLIMAGAPTEDVLPHIVEAVGGSKVLLEDGEIPTMKDKECHPRTCVGYDDEGNVYLIVVDGRQVSFSNGAYLGDMALMLQAAGATHAINLDGGGSSTFVINYDGKLTILNSPSDGLERKDFNSLIVVEKRI